ncbi:MAG: S8 family serine peptidase [Bacteroidales bacterium]|jgi:subtilisin family serine protease|nr:S8 family serine peptidase [Bacteroidales bacterium]
MKKSFLIISLSIFFSLFLKAQEQSEYFYYYQGEKIFLQQIPNKLFIRFTKNINKEQVQNLIKNSRLQLSPDSNIEESTINFIILETKNEKDIPLFTTRETIITNPEIVSVAPIFKYNEISQGLTDEFVVKLQEWTSYEQLQELVKEHDCSIKRENQFIKSQFIISVSKSSKLNAMQMANLFYQTDFFEFSEPNFIVFNAFNSNDTFFDQQWGLKNTGQGSGTSGIDIKAEQVWDITTGTNIRVAVIDHGIDFSHPDLKAHLLQGFDPSGNNAGGAPILNDDNHGTACAGIIGAIQNNGKGISGIAPNCRMIPAYIGAGGSNVNYDWAALAIEWVWRNGVDVISNSWGGGSPYSPLTNAINNAISQGRDGKGCTVVFSTGNNYSAAVNYPAKLSGVISVGAIDNKGIRASFSNYGSELDVVAPGVDIYTTDRQGNAGYNATDYMADFSGTSAACPFVAGVAVLVLSVNPCLTQQEVRNCIEMSCEKIGPYCYSTTSGRSNGSWNNQMGYGLVNAYKAVLYAHSLQTHNFSNITGNTYGSATNNYQFVTSQSSCALVPGVFNVKRTEVRATVSYPYTPAPIVVGTANGFSAANPNNTKQYIGVVNISETSATVNTYVYEGFNVLGQNLGWFPTTPANIKFNFKVVSGFNNDLYFQNKNETGSVSYQAINTIAAGKNVTSAVATGDYTIKSGANVTFHAGKSITLSEGFKAEAGSTFRAYVEPYFLCTFSLKSAPTIPNTDSLPFISDFIVEKSTSIDNEIITLEKPQLKLYPNPTTDNITIEYQLPDNTEIIEITIHDSSGKLVYKLNNTISHEAGIYTLTLQTANLPVGMYICTLKTDKQVFTEKFLKQ